MNVNESGTGGHRRQRLRQLWRNLNDRVFAVSDDRWAQERDLRITRGRFGTRRYRDPRWDLVSECGACKGNGAIGANWCGECEGRGTIRDFDHPDSTTTRERAEGVR